MKWNLEFYAQEKGGSPVENAISTFPKKAGAKIFRWLDLLEKFGLSELRDYITKLEGYELFELRILHASNYYRVFFYPYEEKKVVLFHAFSKNRTKRRNVRLRPR